MDALKSLIKERKEVTLSKPVITNISLRTQIPRCHLLDSTNFVPEHILKYIYRETTSYITYECNYRGRMLILYFMLMDERKRMIDTYANCMAQWFMMLVNGGELGEKCGVVTRVYCYLTPFKKELHGTVLSFDNANSAVTTSCNVANEICIFREEELFKVYVHETFHAFNLDKTVALNPAELNKMKKMFHIKSEFNIYETYSEVWAELINILFNMSGGDIRVTIAREIDFSLRQLKKILAYMGVDYVDLINGRNVEKYKEETNVFCYYVLKAICIFYWVDFVKWCGEKNGEKHIYKYKTTHNAFIEFIKDHYNRPEFINAIELVPIDKTKTMRMTTLAA